MKESPEEINEKPQLSSDPRFTGIVPHGSINDIATLMHEGNESLNDVISFLPKRAEALCEISKKDPVSEKMFFHLVKQCYRYLDTIIDLEEEKEKGVGTEEHKEKDLARGRTHDATISTVNIWIRSLVNAGVDASFLSDITKSRASYGLFAVGLALDVYTNPNLFPDLTSVRK